MAAIPSIKGSVFSAVVEDVNKLLAGDALDRREAARWLRADDIGLLGQEIVVSHWYDIRAYTRMNELLRDVAGGGSNEYLRERGRDTARRLLEAGFYAQLEYLQRAEVSRRTDPQARFEAFGRDLRLLATISGSILNFSQWTPRSESDARRYRIEVSQARDFPEVLCWRSDGFVNEMAHRHGDSDLWCWERPAADLVVFRMTRDI